MIILIKICYYCLCVHGVRVSPCAHVYKYGGGKRVSRVRELTVFAGLAGQPAAAALLSVPLTVLGLQGWAQPHVASYKGTGGSEVRSSCLHGQGFYPLIHLPSSFSSRAPAYQQRENLLLLL